MTYSQPLSLLPLQAGVVVTPLTESAAQGNRTLDTEQRSVVIGEPIPIIFCRRRDSIGGVFVSPAATEGRFANNATTNLLTVDYELVLSEGDMPQLQKNDCWQGACRVGTWTQSYDTRAGTFTPGNVTTVVAGKTPWNCPTFCGTGGSYDNLTTLRFTYTYPDGSINWNKQLHVFVRQGLIVTRIMDSVVGSSDNFIDLAKYLITQTARLPASMIDNTAMLAAATFLDANNFRYNGIYSKSSNLEDWMAETGFGFLLKISDNNGKKGFRPLLPTNANGTIKTTAITPEYTFSEEHIMPDGFEIEYIPLSERKAIAALMLWRQQPDNSIELIRSTVVRLPGTATDGPYEQYDLSQYCVTEAHAVKVGAYIVGKRQLVKHTLRIKARPGAYSSSLSTGDIVRVKLQRETNAAAIEWHDYFYEVERIGKNVSGIVQLDLVHFPVDSQGRSLLALLVNSATASGYNYSTGAGSFTCDVNNPGDTDPLPDDPGSPIIYPDEPTIPSPDPEGKPPEEDNPADPLDSILPITFTGTPNLGNTLTVDTVCANQITNWYLIDAKTGEEELVSANSATYYISSTNSALLGKMVYVEGCCLDAGAPSGYTCRRSAGQAIGGAWTQLGTGLYVPSGSWTFTRSNITNCDGTPGQSGYTQTWPLQGGFPSAPNCIGYRLTRNWPSGTIVTACTGTQIIDYYNRNVEYLYADGTVSGELFIYNTYQTYGPEAGYQQTVGAIYTTTFTDNITFTVT